MCAKYDDIAERNIDFRSYSYTTVFGIFSIEFLLSSVISSYGIFYAEFIQNEIFLPENALWAPIMFVASWNIANPWTRHFFEYFDDIDFDTHRITFLLAPLFLSSVIIMSTLTNSSFYQAIYYGVFGGFCTSVIFSQTKQSTYEDFQAKPLIYDAIRETSRACSLLLMPHFIANMMVRSNVRQVILIFAAILLNIIPIGILLKKKKTPKVSLNRYKTFPGLYDDEIELPTLGTVATNPHYDSESSSTSSFEDAEEEYPNGTHQKSDGFVGDQCEASQQKEVINYAFSDEPKEAQILDGPDSSKPVYPKTLFGFDILPEIPEEDELVEEQKNAENDLKRYSKISSKLDELIVVENLEPLQPQLLQNFGSKMILEEHKSNNCCSPYQNYLHRKRMRVLGEFCNESFWKPLWCSLRNRHFFPSLLTKSSGLFVSTLFLVTIPNVSIAEGHKDYANITLHDSTFLLTVVAFSWMFFLVTLPRIYNLSKTSMKIVFMCGLLTACLGLSLLTRHLSHDILTLSCLVYGLSYGILGFTEEIVFREVIGLRDWKKIQGTLETTSGLLLILFYSIMCNLQVRTTTILSRTFILYAINLSVWISMTVFERVSKSCHDRGSYLIE